MSDLTPEQKKRQDDARVKGRFGVQNFNMPDPSVQLPGTVSSSEARGLEPGMAVLTETNTDRSPFAFALNRSRELRRRWAAAGMPQQLTVLSRRRAPEDGHTDDEITFDLGGEPLVLTFHRDSTFRLAE